MPAIMVHALDGSMLSSRTGIGKLLRIYRGTEAASSVFVISNVASADLAMDSLVSAAAENDERLWARLERSQKAWNEAAEAMLCQDRRSIEDMIASSFSDVEEILKAVWIIRSVPEAAVSHLAKLAGSFLSAIAAERFRLEGIESALLSPEEAVRAVLSNIVRRGRLLEVNTSAYRQGLDEPFPSATILRWYRQEGGRLVSLGSDAHRTDDIAAGFERATTLVEALGLEVVTDPMGKAHR